MVLIIAVAAVKVVVAAKAVVVVVTVVLLEADRVASVTMSLPLTAVTVPAMLHVVRSVAIQ